MAVFVAVLVMGVAAMIRAFQSMANAKARAGAGAAPASSLSAEQIIEEFQRRRRIHVRSLLVMPAAFAYVFLVAHCFYRQPGDLFLGQPFEVHILASFVVLFLAVYIGTSNYKCPACNTRPWGPRGGVLIDPDTCPNCGTRLK